MFPIVGTALVIIGFLTNVRCGSAAVQCGKAVPYRDSGFFQSEAMPPCSRHSLSPIFKYGLPERQSLSALCCGGAANHLSIAINKLFKDSANVGCAKIASFKTV